jgi:hypothetical protein
MEKIQVEVEKAEQILGEVIETSLTRYAAQSYELDQSPPFGGLVRVRDRSGKYEIFGAVSQIATGGLDPGRRAVARSAGKPGLADEQVYQDNPQLNRLLKTVFEVVVLGWRQSEQSRISYVFPDYPPPLHYSVALCSDEQVVEFTSKTLYLRALLNAEGAPVEELVAAVMRRGAAALGGGAKGRTFLVDTGRALARLLKEDYERLRTILEKCDI